EIGHSNIKDFVRPGQSQTASAKGTLFSRDGMALFTSAGPHPQPIRGVLIYFSDPNGYRAVGDYEPGTHYQWADPPVQLLEPHATANVLEAIDPTHGGVELDAAEWRSRDDPAFSSALDVVERIRRREGPRPRHLMQPGDW